MCSRGRGELYKANPCLLGSYSIIRKETTKKNGLFLKQIEEKGSRNCAKHRLWRYRNMASVSFSLFDPIIAPSPMLSHLK